MFNVVMKGLLMKALMIIQMISFLLLLPKQKNKTSSTCQMTNTLIL